MSQTQRINSTLSIGGELSKDRIHGLYNDGFKSVVNLRTSDEVEQGLSPDDEKSLAQEHDMSYLHLPVSMQDLTFKTVDYFRLELKDLPKPVYVHCASGLRAGAFVMMHLAVENGWSSDEALETAESWYGFECSQPQLREFFESYVDEHQEAGAHDSKPVSKESGSCTTTES